MNSPNENNQTNPPRKFNENKPKFSGSQIDVQISNNHPSVNLSINIGIKASDNEIDEASVKRKNKTGEDTSLYTINSSKLSKKDGNSRSVVYTEDLEQPSTSCKGLDKKYSESASNQDIYYLNESKSNILDKTSLEEKCDSFVTVNMCGFGIIPEPIKIATTAIQSDVTIARNEMLISDNNSNQPPPPYTPYNQRQQFNQTPTYQQRQEGLPPYNQVLRANDTRNVAASPMVESRGGGRTWNTYADENSDDFIYMTPFNSTKIRNRFVQRVYSILALQLLITFGFVAVTTYSDPVKIFMVTHPYISIIALIIFMTTFISMLCYKHLRRVYPTNFILLSVFTLSATYIVGYATIFYSTYVVLISAGITLLICLLVSIFACQTKVDVTTWGMFFFIAGFIFIFFMLILWLLPIDVGFKELIIGCIGCILFMGYLLYHTQLIMGGRSIELSPEEYIFAALSLYVDIINIFLSVLRIVGFASR